MTGKLPFWQLSTRIKDAGIAIRHSQGYTFLYCRVQKSILQAPEMSWRGWTSGVTSHKKEVVPKKKQFFVLDKYIEDAKQEEKDVPDLLEAIPRPTDLVKEELRQNVFKLSQFGSKITKIKVSTIWIPEIQSFPAGGQCQASHH